MRRAIWTLGVLAFAVMAVAGPVKMFRLSNASAGDDGAGAEEEPDDGNRVGMAGLSFNPPELTVARGAEVLFDNDDAAPHTVTSEDKSVDSGILNPGKAFRLVVNEPFEYTCLIHPDMKARVLLSG
jgi:plastocyanin